MHYGMGFFLKKKKKRRRQWMRISGLHKPRFKRENKKNKERTRKQNGLNTAIRPMTNALILHDIQMTMAMIFFCECGMMGLICPCSISQQTGQSQLSQSDQHTWQWLLSSLVLFTILRPKESKVWTLTSSALGNH